MISAVKEFFGKYATFTGRTSRKTFWLTILGLFIIAFICGMIGGIIDSSRGLDPNAQTSTTTLISAVLSLAILVPSIAMCVRRLHDINKSGWLYLLCFVPLVGGIILLVFYCSPSVDEGNDY